MDSTCEYMEYRCCMCPQRDSASNQCPPGPFKQPVTPCRFVKSYIDDRGWQYKVVAGIGGSTFKARYFKPAGSGWKCVPRLPWRASFDEAQGDLNAYARKKGWKEYI